MLAGVTQRYQLADDEAAPDQADRLPDATAIILPLFEKACRITDAHSQPLVTLVVKPTLAELKADWKALQDARAKYLK